MRSLRKRLLIIGVSALFVGGGAGVGGLKILNAFYETPQAETRDTKEAPAQK